MLHEPVVYRDPFHKFNVYYPVNNKYVCPTCKKLGAPAQGKCADCKLKQDRK